MPEDDGIGPPPPITPRPPSAPPREDSVEGLVGERLTEIHQGSTQATAPWQNAIAGASLHGKGGALAAGPSGVGPFGAQGVHGEALFGGTPAQAAAAAAGFLGRPISTVVHDVQAYKIREAQEAFLNNHRGWIDRMNDEMDDARKAMDELAKLMPPPSADDKLVKLLQEKRTKGDATMQRINDRLGQDISPEERAKLEAMKADLTNWMKDRDTRVAAEEHDVREADRHLDMLQSHARRMQNVFQTAADRMFWSFPPGDYIVHTQPQAVAFAGSVRGLLLSEHAAMEQAIAP